MKWEESPASITWMKMGMPKQWPLFPRSLEARGSQLTYTIHFFTDRRQSRVEWSPNRLQVVLREFLVMRFYCKRLWLEGGLRRNRCDPVRNGIKDGLEVILSLPFHFFFPLRRYRRKKATNTSHVPWCFVKTRNKQLAEKNLKVEERK